MSKIFLNGYEYVSHGNLYYRIDNKYNAHFIEGNIFQHKDNEMIYVGYSVFSGDEVETHYTKEYKTPIGESALIESKKKYQSERRAFRKRWAGLDEEDFFKEGLNEIKQKYEAVVRRIRYVWF